MLLTANVYTAREADELIQQGWRYVSNRLQERTLTWDVAIKGWPPDGSGLAEQLEALAAA